MIALVCAGCGAAVDVHIVEAGRLDAASELACAGPIEVAVDLTPVEQCAESAPLWQGPDGVIREAPCLRTVVVPTEDAYLIRGCGRSVVRTCRPRCGGEIRCLSDLEWGLQDCAYY